MEKKSGLLFTATSTCIFNNLISISLSLLHSLHYYMDRTRTQPDCLLFLVVHQRQPVLVVVFHGFSLSPVSFKSIRLNGECTLREFSNRINCSEQQCFPNQHATDATVTRTTIRRDSPNFNSLERFPFQPNH